MRDLDEAAAAGNARAKLALDVFAANVRHYLGAYLVELGGAEAIVFTGGIGENQARLPRAGSAGTWKNWASCSTREANVRRRARRRSTPAEPRADLGHPHQRGTDRRPAGPGSCIVGGQTPC